MIKRLFSSKKRLITVVACFFLSIAMIATGAFLSSGKQGSKVLASASQTAEFKVLPGAAIRYDEEKPGIRFQASVNKAQFDAWEEANTEDKDYVLAIGVKQTGYEDQTGALASGDGAEKIIVSSLDIANHDWARGDFTYSVAVILDKAWADATEKDSEQLFNMYAETEFEVAGAYMYLVEDASAVTNDNVGALTATANADNSADTTRTMRSVAAALYATNADVGDANKKSQAQKSYLNDKLGFAINLYDTQSAFFYDLTNDKAELIVEDLVSPLSAGSYKATLGAKDVTDKVSVDGNKITLAGVKADLVKGEKYVLVFDTNSIAYTFSNLTAVTEIITTKERFVELFTLPALVTAEGFDDTYKITESVTAKNGTVYTQDFYSTSAEFFRGYYVLGADIDFANGKLVQTMQRELSTTEMIAANGVIGFGGTFDGNGYSITNFQVAGQGNGFMTFNGLFGALAYGATVKNLALTDVKPYSNEEHHPSTILASLTGSSASLDEDMQAFVMAKFGTTDNILIEDLYVSLNKDKVTANGDVFYTIKGSDTIETYYKWGTLKKSGTTRYHFNSTGLVHSLDSATTTMKNVVYDTPNLGNMPSRAYQFWGLYTNGDASDKTQNAIENCYLIAEDSELTSSKGMIMPVTYNSAGNWDNDELDIHKYSDGLFTFSVEELKNYHYSPRVGTDRFTTKSVLAANDYDGIVGAYTEGDTVEKSVRQGLNGEGNWEYVIADGDAVEGNSYIYRLAGVTRYDNLAGLLGDANLSKLNPNNWDFTGTSAAWKTSHGAGLLVDFIVNGAPVSGFNVGDVATVKATLNGTDVSADLVITADDENAATIAGNQITFGTGSTKLEIKYTSGDKEFVKYVSVGVEQVYGAQVYVSAEESAVRGVDGDYSTFYAKKAGTNDYEATTLLAIYRATVNDNTATINKVYAAESGDYVAQTLVTDGASNQTLNLDANNTATNTMIVISGSKGLVKVPSATVVTAVVTDEYGFKYIPSTAETRLGYYVLANDFEAFTGTGEYNADTIGVNKLNIQAVDGDAKQQIGYSFGATVTPNANTDIGFGGTFDGLGHTVNNLEIASYGLLGVYGSYVGLKPTVKNLKLTNVRDRAVRATAFDGTTYTLAEDLMSSSDNRTMLLANLGYSGGNSYYKDTENAGNMKFENFIMEMATGGFSTNSKYRVYIEQDVADSSTLNAIKTCSFCFIMIAGTNGSNASYFDIRNARVGLYNCVFSYGTRWNMGSRGGAYGAAMFYSFANTNNDMLSALGNYPNSYIGFLNPTYNQNVVFISQALKGATQEATDLGKVLTPFSEAASAKFNTGTESEYTEYYGNLGLAQNDYDALGYEGKSTEATCGLDANGNYIYSTNVADVTTQQTVCFNAVTKIWRIAGYYRYDTYEAMVNAGATTVGDAITITSTGANFN